MLSKNSAKKSDQLVYHSKEKLPKLNKLKTEWDLKNLYYKSIKDPQIEADIKTAEKLFTNFAKKWKSKPFTTDTKVLKTALTELEKISGNPAISKPGRYLSFRTVLKTNDKEAEKKLSLLGRRLRKASDQMLFFTLELGKISKANQKRLLADPSLKHFYYYLYQVFIGAKHDLSEAEEKIIRLKSAQAYGNWTDMTEKIISNRKIKWHGQEVALPEALELIDTLKSQDKPKLWELIITEMEQISEVSEHEFNSIITDVRTEDELRGYKKPYSATALNYEDDETSIEKLVAAVSDKGFKLSQEFYKQKAKLHGVKQLDYSQKYDSIGKDLNISFNQAVEICRDVFYSVKNEYGEFFDTMLTKGQIDVYPKAGKRGGAFMSDQTGHPVHVMLNHTNNFKSLETLAHEMGHAIHANRSATNTAFYDGHSITTAETASTLFENLVFDAVYEQVNEADKVILLHDRITRDISTIERQIAFFNCELEIHETIHREGAMTKEELRDTMYKHLKSYLGPAIKIEPKDGYSYTYIPHLRYGFYVYTYAFGMMMSSVMAKNYKADKSYVEKIDQFLKSGSSATVADIFKSIGINTKAENTFNLALDAQAADIARFSKLVKSK